jgi:acyl dehydratase
MANTNADAAAVASASRVPQIDLASLEHMVGQELGLSGWQTVGQERIAGFAECTGDRQWIHLDAARAARESPFGGTIAHGFLVLALLAPTAQEVWADRLAVRAALNYGLDRVRFVSPVKAGARVRNRITLVAVEDKGQGRVLVTTENTIEIENDAKPAVIATSLVMVVAA